MALSENKSEAQLVKNENIGVNENKLEIFISSDAFKKACEKVYSRECKDIRLDGFRKGKVPKKVIEKVYGKEAFYEGAINSLYSQFVPKIITDEKLDVVDVRDFKIIKANEEEGLSFSIVCTLKPEVKLEKYKEIAVKKPIRKVTEKDVETGFSPYITSSA